MPSGSRTPSLKSRALRYLAAREHSRVELQAKLARHADEGVGPHDIERVLDELAAKGFIDEARVAESVLHRRAPRLGSARVLHELRTKGLPEAVVADAARQLQGSEFDRALAVWRRRFAAPPGDAGERARQLRFLAGRGFSAEVAWRVLSAAAQATGPSNGG